MPSNKLSSSLDKLTKNGGTSVRAGAFGQRLREEVEKASETLPLQEIEIELLHDNPFQFLARPEMDQEKLNELAVSIQENGFQGVLLARIEKGEYQLVYGHRRREAATIVGLRKLPIKIVDLNDIQMARIMATENFSREDLTTMGEVRVIKHLYFDQNLTAPQVAKIVGQSISWVELRVRVAEAPEDVQALVEQKPDSLTHVRILTKLKNAQQRKELINLILHNGLTRDQLEQRVEQLLSVSNPAGTKKQHPKLQVAKTQSQPTTLGQVIDSSTIADTAHYTGINTEQTGDKSIVTDFTTRLPEGYSEISNNITDETNSATEPTIYHLGKIVEPNLETRTNSHSSQVSITGTDAIVQKWLILLGTLHNNIEQIQLLAQDNIELIATLGDAELLQAVEKLIAIKDILSEN